MRVRFVYYCIPLIFLFMLMTFTEHSSSRVRPSASRGRIVIHGGAGTILKQNMTPEMEAEYRSKLTEALVAGNSILDNNGSSLDAVVAVIKILEDSPLFNAGKGAVFTHEGTNELDASIMDGKTLKAGSVAGLKHIKNPIALARLVMEQSPHVMMVGDGAETFAIQHGVDTVPQSYFYTEKRWKQLQQLLEKEKAHPDSVRQIKMNALPFEADEEKLGTVGCVALDKMGNLAAGTSTGGIANKRFGRVGDSPIIGAGTYANNDACAVSATGDGEYFIRAVVAHDIAALVRYRGVTVKEAAKQVIDEVGKLGGSGGVICMDKYGNMAMVFNSEGMYRAYIDEDGRPVVLIYKE